MRTASASESAGGWEMVALKYFDDGTNTPSGSTGGSPAPRNPGRVLLPDQYAEAATGNRAYFLSKPLRIG